MKTVMASPTEDDQKVASELISKWKEGPGLPVRWETMEADVISALAAEREKAAKIADRWAQRHGCDSHDSDPCCHVRTGATIRDLIRGETI